MDKRDYVSEKMHVAVGALCEGDGSFAQRLESATISALARLEAEYLDDELGEDLRFVLRLTKDNMQGGHLVREPDYGERRQLVEAMLRVLVATD